MNTAKVVLSGIAGTTLMTLFSYMVSESKKKKARESKKKNFKEPVLLAALTKKLLPEEHKELAYPAGWLAHYSMGIAMAIAMHELLKKSGIRPGIRSGITAGAIAGIAGILIWKATFKAHPAPPEIHLRNFFPHLLLAHIIFGATAGVVDGSRQK